MTRQPTSGAVRASIDRPAVPAPGQPAPFQGPAPGDDPGPALADALARALDRLGPGRPEPLPTHPARLYDNDGAGIWRRVAASGLPPVIRAYQRIDGSEVRLFAAGQMTPVPERTPSAYLLRRVDYAEYVGGRAHRANAHRFESFATADQHRRVMTDPLEWKVVPL